MRKRDFTQGSVFRHIMVMTLTTTVGLLAMFGVDLTDLIFLSQLGDTDIIAAMGFAGVILFFTQSIGIGLSIAMLAMVSRTIGANDNSETRSTSVNVMTVSMLVALSVVSIAYPNLSGLLKLLGAEGRVADLAYDYMRLLLPVFPILVLASNGSAVIRAAGDARNAMYAMLVGALVNIILDPIFIFVLDMGIEGAALASVFARISMAAYAIYIVVFKYKLIGRFSWVSFRGQVGSIVKFAIPTTFTNFATPIGSALLTYKLAELGTEAVAGSAIISRITPVAFAVFYSLSGAVGPVIGQNYGADQFDRVRETLRESLKFSLGYTLVLWMVMIMITPSLITLFGCEGEVAEMVRAFTYFVIPMTCAMGALFVANAGFNNLGKPTFATLSNFTRNTFGVIPFVWLGAYIDGGVGAIIGFGVGGLICGFISFWYCTRLVTKIENKS